MNYWKGIVQIGVLAVFSLIKLNFGIDFYILILLLQNFCKNRVYNTQLLL